MRKKKSAHDREHELQIKRLEFETQKLRYDAEAEVRARSKSEFDVTKNIRLVPKFQKKDVDKYFAHFEKIAENLKWPRGLYYCKVHLLTRGLLSLVLQSAFIDTAMEVYSALSPRPSTDYDTIKENVFKAYKLVSD
jgi:hypothetical protein